MASKGQRWVQDATLAKLRIAYRSVWARDWPHADGFLRQLYEEATPRAASGNKHWPYKESWQFCLTTMRECDTMGKPEPMWVDHGYVKGDRKASWYG